MSCADELAAHTHESTGSEPKSLPELPPLWANVFLVIDGWAMGWLFL
jgi:hypothetical protein